MVRRLASVRRPHAGRLRARRGRGVRRQEPVAVTEPAAGARDAARAGAGPGAGADRDRPGAHRDRRDGRYPSAREARVPMLGAWRRCSARSCRRSWSTDQFLGRHTIGADPVLDALREVPVDEYAARCGVDEALIRAAARRIAGADSVSTFEDLGIQQGPNSVAVLVPEQAAVAADRQLRRPGGMHLHSWMQPLARHGVDYPRTPVTGTPIIGGLVPCNVIADEILCQHPDRFRAMLVESSNPAHSLARVQAVSRGARRARACGRRRCRADRDRAPRRLRAAGGEPVREVGGDVLQPRVPAQHVPSAGAAARAAGGDAARARDLRPADAGTGRRARGATRAVARCGAGRTRVSSRRRSSRRRWPTGSSPASRPTCCTRRWARRCRTGRASAAAIWGLAHRCALKYPDAVRRAGHAGGEALFEAIFSGRSGITFTLDDYEDAWSYVVASRQADRARDPGARRRATGTGAAARGFTSEELPLVLSAGERRGSTANTIIRDPAWRKRDHAGALRISPDDASRLGLATGSRARVVTAAGSAETLVEVTDAMLPGHISLPNGQGVDYPDASGRPVLTGVPVNELTATGWRDPLAGTPWHKHVPARVEAL